MRKNEANEVTGYVGGIAVLPNPSPDDLRALLRQRAHEAIDALRTYSALLEDLPPDVEPLHLWKLDTEVYQLTAKVLRSSVDVDTELDGWERRREERRSRRSKR